MRKTGGSRRVALITGGNSGIGLALAERLLQNDADIHICLACRSVERADNARRGLQTQFPSSLITTLRIDISSMTSIYQAAEIVKSRFHHIDYIFLNAGIMPVSKVDWTNFWRQLFSSKCVHMFTTGDGLLTQTDSITIDNLPQIFTTNLFGHFVLIKELEEHLGGRECTTQIVWTSSSNAKKEAFALDDFKHEYGKEPYASSKYASDLISYALNTRLNRKGVYSHTTCPGLVMTNLTYGILPNWFWYLITPVMMLLRLFVPSMTLDSANGCEALVWLTQQKPESLNPMSKFHSCTSVTGLRYTKVKQIDMDPNLAEELYIKLSDLELKFRKQYRTASISETSISETC